MPVIQDYYTIDILLHGVDFVSDLGGTSFSISDSLYSLHNTASLTFEDPTGEFTERLMFIKGAPLTIDYGIKGKSSKKSNLILTSFHQPNPPRGTPGIVSGAMVANFTGAWYGEQTIRSSVYEDTISSIIQSIAGKSDALRGISIESTDGVDVWYQPYINDAAFIRDILTPNAFSYDAENTPFYAFTTSDGILRFRSAASIYKDSIQDEIVYISNLHQQNSSPQNVLTVRYMREQEDLERQRLHDHTFIIDSGDARLNGEDDSITDHIPPQEGRLPAIANLDLFTGYTDFDNEELTIVGRNTEKAQLATYHKPGMFLEHLILVTPFNPKLHSGQRVQFTSYTSSEKDRSEESPTFTDRYVIENCEHIWNGEEFRGYTKCILGRKYINTTNRYRIAERLAQ